MTEFYQPTLLKKSSRQIFLILDSNSLKFALSRTKYVRSIADKRFSYSEAPSSTTLQLCRGTSHEVQGRGNQWKDVKLWRGGTIMIILHCNQELVLLFNLFITRCEYFQIMRFLSKNWYYILQFRWWLGWSRKDWRVKGSLVRVTPMLSIRWKHLPHLVDTCLLGGLYGGRHLTRLNTWLLGGLLPGRHLATRFSARWGLPPKEPPGYFYCSVPQGDNTRTELRRARWAFLIVTLLVIISKLTNVNQR